MKFERVKVLFDTYKTGMYLLLSLLVFFLFSLVICYLSHIFGWSEYLFQGQEDAGDMALNLLLTEVQVSFVVVSLSTVLSTSTKKTYWVDNFQYRLVSPKFLNFTALCAYILSALILGGIWIVIGKIQSNEDAYFGVVFSLILSMFWMVVLSASMINANFGKEEIKIQLKKKLKKKIDKIECEKPISDIANDLMKYIPEFKTLEYLTYREIDDKEMDLVYENIDLLLELDQTIVVKKIIKYANKTISTSEMKDELYYEIIKSAYRSHRFYREYDHTVVLMPDILHINYGIPIESQIDALRSVLDDEFIKAGETKKYNESISIRLKLYKILVYALSYYCGILFSSERYSKLENEARDIKAGILNLMASFVYCEWDQKGDIIEEFKKDAEDVYFQSLPDDREYLLDKANVILSEFENMSDEYLDCSDLSWYSLAREF